MTKHINAEAFFKLINTTLPYGEFDYPDKAVYNAAISDVCDMLIHFPAADVAPRWIPVTERLPEERGTYLVTVVDGTIKRAVAQWWHDVDNGKGYFVCDDCYAEDIVAWMPLPEPYKGGEEE